MINSVLFIVNDLLFSTLEYDNLYKVGMYTVFIKQPGTSYDFGGVIKFESPVYVVFAGNPKRISIQDENMTECVELSYIDNYIAKIQTIKQTYKVEMTPHYFTVDGVKYTSVSDLDLF